MMMQLSLNILLQALALAASNHDYTTAFRDSEQTGKPLVVLIGADWCPGCRTMKQSSMPEVQKRGGLDNVAYAVVNTDQEHQLAGKLMQGSSIPQLVLFQKTEAGWKRKQLTGAHSAGDIQAFIKQAAEASTAKLSSND